jgi:hypothetical protein
VHCHAGDLVKHAEFFFLKLPTQSMTYSQKYYGQHLSDLTLFNLCFESLVLSQANGMRVDESCGVIRLEISMLIHGHKILVVESRWRASSHHSNYNRR